MSKLSGSGDNSTADGPQATESFLDAPDSGAAAEQVRVDR